MPSTESPEPDALLHNLPVYSVGEISQALKRAVEDGFASVRVRGEVSGFKRAASGHLYFALKDADAVLDAVCWRGTAARLGLAPEDGMEIVASGRLTTYPGRSKYQIVVEAVELAGEGALLKLLEERRRKLAAEGLFDAARKRALPFLPAVIGVVTSPTGAVIRDILHRLSDRFPRRVLVWPVLVQGDGAAAQVARAIEGFNKLPEDGAVPRPDLLIVARGGGSLEDLWAFNEEIVVRAAAASDIPLISAVGHETDTTLIDFAADRRAPTPTAAAEMAVPVRLELAAQVADLGLRTVSAMARRLDHGRLRLEGLGRGLPDLRRLTEDAAQRLDDWAERLANSLAVGLRARRDRLDRQVAALRHPKRDLQEARRRLDGLAERLPTSLIAGVQTRRARLENQAAALRHPRHEMAQAQRRLDAVAERLPRLAAATLRDRRSRLAHAGALLDSYAPQRVLERGFVLVTDAEDRPVTTVKQARPNSQVTLRFHDGAAAAVVTGRAGRGPAGSGTDPAPTRRKKEHDDRQEKLL